MNDVTAEGSRLITRWLQAVESVERAKSALNRSQTEELNAEAELAKWLMPADMKPGEKVEVLRAPIRLVDVRREPLRRMIDDIEYGIEECKLEGFDKHPVYCWPSEFVNFFCSSHRPCDLSWTVTRLQFEYTTERTGAE